MESTNQQSICDTSVDNKDEYGVRVCENSAYSDPYQDDISRETTMKSMELMKALKALRLRRNVLRILSCFAAVVVIMLIVFIALYAMKPGPGLKARHESNETDYCSDRKCVITASRMIEAMNRSADPCHNFYQYACANWIKKASFPVYGGEINKFVQLDEANEILLRQILEDLISNRTASTEPLKKALTFYKSCKDVRQIEKVGDKRIKEYVEKLGSWPVTDPHFNSSGWKLLDTMISANKDIGIEPLFRLRVGTDLYHSNIHVLIFELSGMNSGTSYLSNKTRHVSERVAYKKLMKAIATQMGANDTGLKLIEEVYEFEIALAAINVTELANYKMTLGEFINRTGIPKEWLVEFVEQTVLLGKGNISLNETIISYNTVYIKHAFKLLTRLRIEVQASYVIWRAVHIMMRIIRFVPPYKNIYNDYYGTTSGSISHPPRWKTCVDDTTNVFSYALSRLFVERSFDKTATTMTLELIQGIKEEFEKNIDYMDWIDEKTRDYAKRKAYMITSNIGYPVMIFNNTEVEDNYDDLKVLEGEYFLNVIETKKHERKTNYLKFGQPVDKKSWPMLPTTVNAVYYPEGNTITFPAAILKWPFFDSRYPRAVSYGGFGTIVGHEISHGFDNDGIKYNIDGDYGNWWTSHSSQEFKNRSQCFVKQYNNFSMFGKHCNGEQTLGENIADNGGLRLAFQAYRSWVDRNGRENKLVGLDLTPDQLYFLSFAQLECTKYKKPSAISQMDYDVHSLAPFRVNGPLQNYDEFSKVYNCPIGSAMNPRRKCRLW